MADNKYSFQGFAPDKMAKAKGINLPISTKKTIEIASFIKGKTIKQARSMLGRVLKMEDAVPYRRFNQELAHNQRGPGGYPIKAIEHVLALLDNAESNAKAKGLNVEELRIVHINAHKGPKNWHYGRQKRRLMKRTHVEVVVEEVAAKKAKPTKAKAKAAPKKAAVSNNEKQSEKKETKEE